MKKEKYQTCWYKLYQQPYKYREGLVSVKFEEIGSGLDVYLYVDGVEAMYPYKSTPFTGKPVGYDEMNKEIKFSPGLSMFIIVVPKMEALDNNLKFSYYTSGEEVSDFMAFWTENFAGKDNIWRLIGFIAMMICLGVIIVLIGHHSINYYS